MMISTEKISHHSTPHSRKSWVGERFWCFDSHVISVKILSLRRVDIFLKPTKLRHTCWISESCLCKPHKVSSCSSPERVVRIWSLLLWNCDTLSILLHTLRGQKRSVKSSGNKELNEEYRGWSPEKESRHRPNNFRNLRKIINKFITAQSYNLQYRVSRIRVVNGLLKEDENHDSCSDLRAHWPGV